MKRVVALAAGLIGFWWQSSGELAAQALTKEDVHKALVEHHMVLNSYCLSIVFEDLAVGDAGDDGIFLKRLLGSGHAEPLPGTSLSAKLTTEGRKYVQRNVRTSMMDGRFLHCFAIGKVSVSDVNVFRLVAGTADAEASYTILVRDLPEWLRTIDIGTYQPGPVFHRLVHPRCENVAQPGCQDLGSATAPRARERAVDDEPDV